MNNLKIAENAANEIIKQMEVEKISKICFDIKVKVIDANKYKKKVALVIWIINKLSHILKAVLTIYTEE